MESFETTMQRIEEISEVMADENTGLEKSIELYAEAAQLIQNCTKTLKEAEVRVREIDERLGELERQDGL